MIRKMITGIEQDNNKLQMLLDNIRENFFSADWVNNKVTYISDICHSIYGYPPQCFLDNYKFWFEVIHPDDKEMVMKSNQALVNGEKATREYRIIHADGSVRWVQNTIVPTLNEKGEVIRVDGYTSDITERKKSLSLIEELNTMICRASHDLKGPLNSAKNYIAIAKNEVIEENALKYLNKINAAYDNMEQQVLSLLNLEKLHCSKANNKRIIMKDLIIRMLASINNLRGFNKTEVIIDVENASEIYSDIDCMYSILYNLVSNAIVYRRDETDSFVKISSSFNNEHYIIKVSDNGIGIAENKQNRMFEKYAKDNNSSGGHGLGLYIVKKMVEKMNGKISVVSQQMKGTTFTVELPVIAQPNNIAV